MHLPKRSQRAVRTRVAERSLVAADDLGGGWTRREGALVNYLACLQCRRGALAGRGGTCWARRGGHRAPPHETISEEGGTEAR